MAAKKPLVVSSGKVERIQAGDSLDAINVTSGADPGHTHSVYLKADGTVALTGNLAVDAAVTIDGRDISVDGVALDALVIASGSYLKADGTIPLTADWTTGIFSIIGSDHWYLRANNAKLFFGAANSASIYYNATDLVIDTQEAGTGNLSIPNGTIGLGVAPVASVGINISLNTSLIATVRGVTSIVRYGSAGSGNNAGSLYGAWNYTQTGGTYDGDITGSIYGASLEAHHYGTGTVNQMYGDRIWLSTRPNSGTVSGMTGLHIAMSKYALGGAITNAYGINVGSINIGSALNYAICTNAGQVRIGDDLFFAGAGSGLPHAGIYCHDVTSTLTIASSGEANKVQVTQFTANETSNLMTPDHTNDHITVVKTGVYLVTASISISSTGGTSYEVMFGCWKNNGATEFLNLHSHRMLAGGGGDKGSMTISGLVSLTATDTLELWCANITNTNNVIIESITLSAVMVGG